MGGGGITASVNENTEVIKGGASGGAPNAAASPPKTTLFANLQLTEHVDMNLGRERPRFRDEPGIRRTSVWTVSQQVVLVSLVSIWALPEPNL